MQVVAHHRLHRLDVQHPPGLQAGPHRAQRQRGQQALQQVRGVDEVRQAETLAAQAEQRVELRQQARLHADAQARRLAQRAQVFLDQGAVQMHPEDRPGPPFIGAIGMRPALGQH
ncbi:hypothetical protein D9M71_425540 [compost metagenome]